VNLKEWHYHHPTRIICGAGVLGGLAGHIGFRRLILVTSPGFSRRGVVAQIEQALGQRLLKVLDGVEPNPDLSTIDRQAAPLRELQADAIIALGGGSSMDTAKALARLLSQPATLTLAAHFRDGVPFNPVPALPVVAIPTTSGTGAEVTPFGTVWDFERRKKYSIVGDDLYPALAVLDPELTLVLPEEVTISSGLDAVSHALESTWNKNANPLSLGLAAKSLQLSMSALPRLKTHPEDLAARGAMMQASLLAGMAISQTRTALAHSISYPLTARFKLPHGIACSFSLPVLMLFNAQADDGRLLQLARAVGFAGIGEFAGGLRQMFHELGVAAIFKRYVPDAGAIMEMTGLMFAPGRADNNIRMPSMDDIAGLVRDAAAHITGNYAATNDAASG
jgi:alcohol dehydrogenase